MNRPKREAQMEIELSREENARLLAEWRATGPQGPIDDEEGSPEE